MRTWLIYGSVVLVSVVAGVIIGGGPGALLGSSESSSFVSSADDVPPAAPEVEDVTVASAPETTERSEPATTDLAAVPTDAAPVETTIPAETTAAATATTTVAEPVDALDEPVDTSPPSEPDEVDVTARVDLSVAVLNGIGTPGLAGRAADALAGLGYIEPMTRDTDPAARTLVYFRAGLDGEASRLAVDSGLPANATVSLDDVGSVADADADEFDLMLILGADRIGLASA